MIRDHWRPRHDDGTVDTETKKYTEDSDREDHERAQSATKRYRTWSAREITFDDHFVTYKAFHSINQTVCVKIGSRSCP